jgi:hypothetical protein
MTVREANGAPRCTGAEGFCRDKAYFDEQTINDKHC